MMLCMEWNAYAHVSCNASAHASLTLGVLQYQNFLLNACVLLRSENIVATTDQSLSVALLRDEQRLSLGEFVDGS
jgi:hypothetical protein